VTEEGGRGKGREKGNRKRTIFSVKWTSEKDGGLESNCEDNESLQNQARGLHIAILIKSTRILTNSKATHIY
jgi:hypothetical protein